MMDNKSKDNFMKRLLESAEFLAAKAVFDDCGEGIVWWAASLKVKRPLIILKALSKGRSADKIMRKSRNITMKAVVRSGRAKKLINFNCGPSMKGLCMPVVRNDNISGFLGAYYKSSCVPDKAVKMLHIYISTLLDKLDKEDELTRLHETIKPRAIALSTIHTVHRLLSSTLDLDELLPKIARLCIQVLRVKRCTIMLMDKSKGILVPIISIDYKNRAHETRPSNLGSGVAGKVAKTCKIKMASRILCIPLIDADVVGTITVYEKENQRPFDIYDREILVTFAEQAVIALRNAQLYKEQQDLVMGSIKSFAALLKIRAQGAYMSPEILSSLSRGIGELAGLKEEELKWLDYATQLHDAGQIILPDKILTKSDKLTGKEFKLIKEHPEEGVKIIEPLKALQPAIPIILYHHERFDGSGYPKGLKGAQIPLSARIMSLVCAFEAMLSKRPYRTRKSIREAVFEIKNHSGTQFDPRVVRMFLNVLARKDVIDLIKKETYAG